jgi:SpoVK/Ycf46/Vps4 family AAA+-type ATPase
MLSECEQVVVLFDEIEELVRERGVAGEALSRFLTTAMLPKLAALSNRRRIVYLVATNHLEVFDAAIRRPGRFDMILPVNTPTAEAKLAHWPWARERLEELGLLGNADILDLIESLTYGEFEDIAQEIAEANDEPSLRTIVERAERNSVLRQSAVPELLPEGDSDWKTFIEQQQERTRLPPTT